MSQHLVLGAFQSMAGGSCATAERATRPHLQQLRKPTGAFFLELAEGSFRTAVWSVEAWGPLRQSRQTPITRPLSPRVGRLAPCIACWSTWPSSRTDPFPAWIRRRLPEHLQRQVRKLRQDPAVFVAWP